MAIRATELEYLGLLSLRALEASRLLDEFRAKLAEDCDHPASFLETYRWEHDNGYGSQSWRTGNVCTICRKRDPWKSGVFYGPDGN